MLNRRHLRIKVLQALYAFLRSGNDDIPNGEKELFHSLNKIQDLYIWVLLIFGEIHMLAVDRIEDNKKKRLPTREDLDPNTKFVNNVILNLLADNEELLRQADARKLSWAGQRDDLVKKIFRSIVQSPEYDDYMMNPELSFEDDLDFMTHVFKRYIANSELLYSHLEEHSIYWMDDIDLVFTMILKTMKSFRPNSMPTHRLLPLYKDPEDETKFIKELYRQSIMDSDENEKRIQERAQNWEIERIAVMDMIIMKMAITEVMRFPTIPVKVTLNEYIEISKFYSTPKSSVFINGILDRLFEDLKASGDIRKVGRGLVE